MFVLDTNVISELRKTAAGRADPNVVNWANQTSPQLMFLSAISIHELEHGVLLAERSDPHKGSILRCWLDDDVIPAFAGRILDVNAEIAISAAGFNVPDPAPFRDSLIAATALAHKVTVVTRNLRDFERYGTLDVLNPWDLAV